MKKIILILALAVLIFSLSKLPENKEDKYSYTKAICNQTNYCQDFEIKCRGEKLIKTTPITGAVVQFSRTWKDSREKKELCN